MALAMGDTSSGRRVPPQSVEAEEAVLGGILLDNRALDAALTAVRPEDFYRESHRRIFRAMIDLDERGEPSEGRQASGLPGRDLRLEECFPVARDDGAHDGMVRHMGLHEAAAV